MKIAIDAMGGDYAPAEVVKGAVEAAGQCGIPVILVGDQEIIEQELAKYDTDGLPIEVKHASQVVEMDDHPANAIRRKTDSSLVISAKLVKDGEAQAMVSAGNSGATMAVATLKLGRIPGIDRPAIASFLPTSKGMAVMLDAGANVDCSVDNLLQFAVIGSEYAEHVLGIETPRVGLLSIGEEETKGDELTKATNARLKETDLNFIGNVEGKDIFRGASDVVICDGFAGNIVLKVAEGVGEFVLGTIKSAIDPSQIELFKPVLSKVMAKLDYAEYGGAPLLGVGGVCIICHGRSNARAIRNAIKAASTAVENNVVSYISMALRNRSINK